MCRAPSGHAPGACRPGIPPKCGTRQGSNVAIQEGCRARRRRGHCRSAHGFALAQGASPDDVATFLAGMQPSAGSPLAALTRNPGWQRHAKWFDSNWDTLEKRQLSKVRAWSERHLKDTAEHAVLHVQRPRLPLRQRVLSAGQHLSAERPRAGRRDPDRHRAHDRLAAADPAVDRHVAAAELLHHPSHAQPAHGGDLAGTLPILYVYIARSGKTIREVSLVNLDRDGTVHPAKGEARNMSPASRSCSATGNGPDADALLFPHRRLELRLEGQQAS